MGVAFSYERGTPVGLSKNGQLEKSLPSPTGTAALEGTGTTLLFLYSRYRVEKVLEP